MQNNKEYLSYLLTFQNNNYYLDNKNNKIYVSEYRQELNFSLTNLVPAASILLLNITAYFSKSHISLLMKLVYLLLGFLVVVCFAELVMRKQKGLEFKEFSFGTLFAKDEFLLIFSRNVYGKLGVGFISVLFTFYQLVEYVGNGNFLAYLLCLGGVFMTYISFIQSHLIKQLMILKDLKNYKK